MHYFFLGVNICYQLAVICYVQLYEQATRKKWVLYHRIVFPHGCGLRRLGTGVCVEGGGGGAWVC